MDNRKPKCYNCIFASKPFKVSKLTHHHCEHIKFTLEGFGNGDFTVWDTLVIYSETCKDHEFKKESEVNNGRQ